MNTNKLKSDQIHPASMEATFPSFSNSNSNSNIPNIISACFLGLIFGILLWRFLIKK